MPVMIGKDGKEMHVESAVIESAINEEAVKAIKAAEQVIAGEIGNDIDDVDEVDYVTDEPVAASEPEPEPVKENDVSNEKPDEFGRCEMMIYSDISLATDKGVSRFATGYVAAWEANNTVVLASTDARILATYTGSGMVKYPDKQSCLLIPPDVFKYAKGREAKITLDNNGVWTVKCGNDGAVFPALPAVEYGRYPRVREIVGADYIQPIYLTLDLNLLTRLAKSMKTIRERGDVNALNVTLKLESCESYLSDGFVSSPITVMPSRDDTGFDTIGVIMPKSCDSKKGNDTIRGELNNAVAEVVNQLGYHE